MQTSTNGASLLADLKGWRPTEREELLLRAALGDELPAQDAWRRWRQGDASEDRPTSHTLLPAVYANLRRFGAADLAFARPWYANALATNARLLNLLPQATKLAAAEGAPVMLLKGAAIIAAYLNDPGARPLGDLDLLVPERQFVSVHRRFTANGWVGLYGTLSVVDTRFFHATPLESADGRRIDLHCHPLLENCAPDGDARYWAKAVPMTVEGSAVRVPCPADLLVMTAVHGTRPGPEHHHHLRWILDASTIVAAGGVDWDRVIEVAESQGIAPVVAAALDYLAEGHDAPVPASSIVRLRAASSNPSATTLWHVSGVHRVGNPAASLRWHWAILSRGAATSSMIRRMALLPQYFRMRWQVDHMWKFPWALAQRVARLFGHHLGLYSYPGLE